MLGPYAPPGMGSCVAMPPTDEKIKMSLGGELTGNCCSSSGRKARETMSDAMAFISSAARRSSPDVLATGVRAGQ